MACPEISRGKRRRRRWKKKPQGKNIMACPMTTGGHNKVSLSAAVILTDKATRHLQCRSPCDHVCPLQYKCPMIHWQFSCCLSQAVDRWVNRITTSTRRTISVSCVVPPTRTFARTSFRASTESASTYYVWCNFLCDCWADCSPLFRKSAVPKVH